MFLMMIAPAFRDWVSRSTARGARTIMGRKWGACVAGWRAALHLRPDGRIEADGHWMFQLRSADRSTLFSGIILCRHQLWRARVAVSDFACGAAAITPVHS